MVASTSSRRKGGVQVGVGSFKKMMKEMKKLMELAKKTEVMNMKPEKFSREDINYRKCSICQIFVIGMQYAIQYS